MRKKYGGKSWQTLNIKVMFIHRGLVFGSINSIIINKIYISLLHHRKFQIAFWPETPIVSYLVSYVPFVCRAHSADTVPIPGRTTIHLVDRLNLHKIYSCVEVLRCAVERTKNGQYLLKSLGKSSMLSFVASHSTCLKIYLYITSPAEYFIDSARSFLIPNPNISGRTAK